MEEDVKIKVGADVSGADQKIESLVRKTESRTAHVKVDAAYAGGGAPSLSQYERAYGPVPTRGYPVRPGTESDWAQWHSANRPTGPASVADAGGPVSRAREANRTWLTQRDVVEPQGMLSGLLGGGLRQGRLGQLATIGFGLQEAGHLAQAFQRRDSEYNLAIGDRGGEDSLRKYKAEIAVADQIERIPIIGGLIGKVVESATHGRERAQGTIEAAERQGRNDELDKRRDAIRQQTVDYFRGVEGRSYSTLGRGEAEQARRQAEVARNEALIEAQRSYSRGMGATDDPAKRKNIQSRYDDATKGIEDAFARVTERIARAADVSLRSVTDQKDVLGLRGSGRDRDADRMELKRSVRREMDAEEDPIRRRAIQEAGVARLDAVERINAREDYFRGKELEGDVAVTGLQADRKPFSAQAEAIFRRGQLQAERLDIEHPDQARLVREATRNELRTLKNNIDLNGQGVEVPAGSFGPGGTAYGGSGGPDDSGQASELLKKMIEELAQIKANTANTARPLAEMVTDDGT